MLIEALFTIASKQTNKTETNIETIKTSLDYQEVIKNYHFEEYITI